MKDIKEKVFMALGEASMCWIPTPTGIFDSTRAKRIGEDLLLEITSQQLNNCPAAICAQPYPYFRNKYPENDLLKDLIKLADERGYRVRIESQGEQWALQMIPLDVRVPSGPVFTHWSTLETMILNAITFLKEQK